MIQEAVIAVVGGGPGGLSAALAAKLAGAGSGARVVVLDGYPAPGGQYYHQPPEWRAAQATRRQRKGRELWERAAAAGVEICPDTLVWNIAVGVEPLAEKILSVVGPKGAGEVRAKAVILATGAYERTAVFPGWTLPGVITAGAAQMLLYHEARPGRKVLLAGTGPLQLLVAEHLLQAGVQVVAVLEGAQVGMRQIGQAGALWGQWERLGEGLTAALRLAGERVPYRMGWGIVAAHGVETVEGAAIARLDRDWRPVPRTERAVECDTICTGYGFIPFHALAKLAGAALEWRPDLGGEIPRRDARMQTNIAGFYAVGDGAGIGGYRLSMLEGEVAGMAAAAHIGLRPSGGDARQGHLEKALRRERAFQKFYAGLFTPGPGIYELARPDTLVCRCESVTQEQLQRAVEAGATTSVEVKALTRCGMGPCQGRVCGQHVAQTVARLTGRTPEAVGLNSARPPIFPLRMKDLE